MTRKKTIEITGVPLPLWATIREAAHQAGHPTIAAFARSLLYKATQKSDPRLWDLAARESRRRSGIPDAMYIINPQLKPPTTKDSPS